MMNRGDNELSDTQERIVETQQAEQVRVNLAERRREDAKDAEIAKLRGQVEAHTESRLTAIELQLSEHSKTLAIIDKNTSILPEVRTQTGELEKRISAAERFQSQLLGGLIVVSAVFGSGLIVLFFKR
jgi:hypothetical protein